MSTNFEIFDENEINMVDDATYASSTQRLNGVVPGIALSAIHNKLFRQTSVMAAALAQVMSDEGESISDSDYAGLIQSIQDVFIQTPQVILLPRGYIGGLNISNNASDANNDIDFSVGECIDSTNAENIVLASALTKRTDALWVVGDGQGGMDTGTKPANGTLHCFVIKRSDTGVVDALFSQSTTPTLPANYDYYRRVGSFTTSSSINVGFYQNGDNFSLKASAGLVNLDGLVSTTRYLATLPVPSGLKLNPQIAIASYNESSYSLIITDPDYTDSPAGSGRFSAVAYSETFAGFSFGSQIFTTNTSRQLGFRASKAVTGLVVDTWGWVDNRGRFN